MPIIICLKEPNIVLVVEGQIDEGSAQKYDDIFQPRGCLFLKRKSGFIVVPIDRDVNIVYLEDVTEEELERRRKDSELAGRGSMLSKPNIMGIKKIN